MTYHTQVAGRLGGQRVCFYLCQHWCWPSMSIETNNVAKNCTYCARELIKIWKHDTELKLFPAIELITYVSVDILVLLIESNNRNTALLVMWDRLSKLTKTVYLRTKTAHEIATAFTKHWIFLYGLPSKLLAENRKRFTFAVFHKRMRTLLWHTVVPIFFRSSSYWHVHHPHWFWSRAP